jgi:hypothetical protein
LGWSLHAHAGQPVQPGALDLQPNVGRCAAQTDRPALAAQAPGKHRQVHHQGDVGESKLAHVHDNVALGTEGPDKRLSPAGLGDPVFISATAQHGGLFAEIDDVVNLVQIE